MVVLDSDILVGILRGDKDATKFLERMESDGEKLNTTVINACELLEGAMLHAKKDDFTRKVELLLGSFGSLSFTISVSWVAAEISADLRKRGEMIDAEDIYIAAIAKVNGEIIVTRNAKHFGRIKGIQVRKW